MRSLIVAVGLLALAVAPAVAEKIELENGDTIDVTIVSETEDSLVVEHPQLGEITVPRSALKPPDPPEPGLFGTRFMEGWERAFGFGFGGSTGNSQDASVNGSLDISKKTDAFRGTFDSSYFYASQNSVRNTNAFTAGYKHDFLMKESRFFFFLAGRYQYDQFQDWRHRISGNGGVGYDILRKDDYDLSVEIGAGFARTQGTEVNSVIVNRAWKPEGVAGLSGSWRPFEGHEFSADVTFFPNFRTNAQGVFEFRVLANASYQIAVTAIDGLSLKFGVRDEYDKSIDTSVPVPGVVPARLQQRNNVKYYGNLVYEF